MSQIRRQQKYIARLHERKIRVNLQIMQLEGHKEITKRRKVTHDNSNK